MCSSDLGLRIVNVAGVYDIDNDGLPNAWELQYFGSLTAAVPTIAREHVGGDVERFLAANGLARTDIEHWIVHTGGPKVLDAFAEALALPANALERSWDSLRRVGNLSSSSVLFVLESFLRERRARSGEYGLLLAMGPGFCSEMALLEW